MKKILCIFFILIFTLSFISWVNCRPENIINKLSKEKRVTPSGELRYRVYALWILPVGDAVFEPTKIEELKGKKVYHLQAKAQNLSFYNAFFKAKADIESYVEVDTFDPLIFRQSISIAGKPTVDKEVIYDQSKNTMSLAGVKREILPHTQDPISAINNIRQIDFSKVKTLEMNINTNQKNYILEGSARQQDIKIKGKSYVLTHAKAQIRRRDKNNPYHRSQVNMVLVRVDNQNIPILIKVFASGFPITARLVEIK